ncbi:hypothetical protein COCSUDRAFT_31992 [Coccomyxa subellipsoidea C-169]|uniref:Uncharacterized protein n=1 Tax=Coccomyxa subellipsoidea (strain C-169) TaxID=574566 RepID=I0Z9R6_COCSC|nr:hypothetical protein COCSUDRAFT_31992 [Coccomyxa subellipsoidea C-169]EIE27385.1 hypothetical protein COCSUDRAFT_31992 [Coccomyxa subellipsoidea C-169]|eukprot:XP_005651929.1 hypothetical protein COCSUDRAFT_31992 [Coccomyxa subellipsoidea C-169]
MTTLSRHWRLPVEDQQSSFKSQHGGLRVQLSRFYMNPIVQPFAMQHIPSFYARTGLVRFSLTTCLHSHHHPKELPIQCNSSQLSILTKEWLCLPAACRHLPLVIAARARAMC